MTGPWAEQYYDAILTCVARYREMAEGMPDLLTFLDEFTRDVPLMKLSRWLGYVQGVLITRGVTTVTIERDATRPLFRPLDFAPKPQNESTLAVRMRELLGAWERGELAKWEYETAVKKVADEYWSSRATS